MFPLALQQVYDHNNAGTVWELWRAWLNSDMFGTGWYFSADSANAIMLVSALVFIFLVEVLLTIGIQIWERRLLARMQQRRGPQEYGGITEKAFRRIAGPILILLAFPAVLYGIEYRTANEFNWQTAAILGGVFFFAGLVSFALVKWDSLFTAPVYERGPLGKFVGFKAWMGRALRWPLLAAGVFALIVAAMEPLPQISFGNGYFVPNVTVICSVLAFLIYIVYMAGWYWRQGIFDAIKLMFKEDVVPLNADRFLFLIAPILAYVPALLSWIVIPFGVAQYNGQYYYLIVKDLNVGILLIIADFAMFLVAIIMSGYASNNKYALMGAMREAAMLLTYEIPMLMSLLCVALFAGSLNLTEIVQHQQHTWAILPLFPAFVILFVASLAETNRPPFDLPEASNELLGGYVVEYSGMRFALFYIAEYANVFIVSAEIAICFLGGWKGPMFLGYDGLWLTSMFWFLLKVYALIFFFIWARATMPRIRIDQIMFFSWKFLLPASVVSLIITAVGIVNRHPWFTANQFWSPEQFDYISVSTADALVLMSAHERAFFWGYNLLLLAFGIFILVMAWRILFGSRVEHPQPRRALTWM